MKFCIILLSFLSSAILVKAQDINNYANADRVAHLVPASLTNSTTEIASYINNYCKTDEQRVRAIYTWVTTNITYDSDSIHMVISDEDNDQRISYALKRKRGVCENFAAIFTDLCLKSNIQSYAIEGFTKQNGAVDRIPHVWCAALIDGKWFLYDPTWDAGYLVGGRFENKVDDNYFQKTPENFISTHMPFDPLFQFLNYPVTYSQFTRGITNQNSSKAYFNYTDSIKQYATETRLSRYLSAMDRIKNIGWPLSKIDTKLKRLRFEIELINQDSDMDLYNATVDDYNKAIAFFNDFVNYRNNNFLPAKEDREVEDLFNNVNKKITDGLNKIKMISLSQATLTLDTGDIHKKLTDLLERVKKEQAFYKNYKDSLKE